MQKYRSMLRRRATSFLIDWLVIVLFVTVWMVARKPVPPERTIPYINTSDHILVQLAQLPQLDEADMHTVVVWTLFGDGTLIFRTDPSDNLWRAHLSPGEIQHVLDVIINNNTFFDSTAQRYGSITPESDDDELLLTVNVNGHQKEVVLLSEPTNQAAIDLQTTHVFAIKRFLLAYRPAHTLPYVPRLDPASLSGDGKR